MRFQRLVLLTGAFMAAPACSQGSSSALHGALDARYAAMKAAMASKDDAAIRSLLADGFVSIDVRGKSEDATRMIEEVLALPSDPTRLSQTTIVSVKADNRTAIVEQRYEMTKQTSGQDGGQHSAALSTLSRDTWVNDHGSWRIARTVTEQLDYSVDGITMAHDENSFVR